MVKIFLLTVAILVIAITCLLHSIEGVDLWVWYVIAVPLVLIRVIRGVLLILSR